MKKVFLVCMILVLVFSFAGCSSNVEDNGDTSENLTSEPVNILVGAAASLTDAFTEIEPLFEEEYNITVDFNFASSGKLQKQIEEGAPMDVFVSAATDKMDIVEEKNLIDSESRENLLKNDLVMLVADEYKDKVKSPDDLVGSDALLSIGEPETVPAGKYAKEALEYLHIWDKLEQGSVVLAKDVSQVLAYVEKGEVAAGIVYSSDAVRASSGSIGYEFADETHTPIVYPSALVTASTVKESGQVFLDFLRTEEAQNILVKYGFMMYTE